MSRIEEGQEEEIRARLNAVVPFYSEMEQWANMEPLQARLPFVIMLK